VATLTRQLRYALCPKCGSVVEARVNDGPRLTCSHCRHEFDSSAAKVGLVTHDDVTGRWTEASSGRPHTARPPPVTGRDLVRDTRVGGAYLPMGTHLSAKAPF
jgi:hypothetical protein